MSRKYKFHNKWVLVFVIGFCFLLVHCKTDISPKFNKVFTGNWYYCDSIDNGGYIECYILNDSNVVFIDQEALWHVMKYEISSDTISFYFGGHSLVYKFFIDDFTTNKIVFKNNDSHRISFHKMKNNILWRDLLSNEISKSNVFLEKFMQRVGKHYKQCNKNRN